MTVSTQAVFLSYASEDAEAAARICDALRAAGVKVWFDKSELRGGDAWDLPNQEANPRLRVVSAVDFGTHHCADRRLFPARVESCEAAIAGHGGGPGPFLVPVVIDETSESDARVPEEFLHFAMDPTAGR